MVGNSEGGEGVVGNGEGEEEGVTGNDKGG